MPKYRVIEYVIVKVTSEPIVAEQEIVAYLHYRGQANLDELLRNMTGTKIVSGVEYDDFRQSAVIEELDENGYPTGTALHFSSEELNDLV
jgi:hypothetical protein